MNENSDIYESMGIKRSDLDDMSSETMREILISIMMARKTAYNMWKESDATMKKGRHSADAKAVHAYKRGVLAGLQKAILNIRHRIPVVLHGSS